MYLFWTGLKTLDLFFVKAKKSALITDLFVSVIFWIYLLRTLTSPKSISLRERSTMGPVELALTLMRCCTFLSEIISMIKSISKLLMHVVVRFMFILMDC